MEISTSAVLQPRRGIPLCGVYVTALAGSCPWILLFPVVDGGPGGDETSICASPRWSLSRQHRPRKKLIVPEFGLGWSVAGRPRRQASPPRPRAPPPANPAHNPTAHHPTA